MLFRFICFCTCIFDLKIGFLYGSNGNYKHFFQKVFRNPLEILDEGIRYTETKEVFDDEGNRSVIEDKGKEGVFNTNSVIIAVSQGPRSNIVSTTKGINTLPSGLVHVDEYGRTSRDGVFASGDVVTGAKTVVEAVRLSKKVAEAIEEYVTSN